jgi:hypothetical protein
VVRPSTQQAYVLYRMRLGVQLSSKSTTAWAHNPDHTHAFGGRLGEEEYVNIRVIDALVRKKQIVVTNSWQGEGAVWHTEYGLALETEAE